MARLATLGFTVGLTFFVVVGVVAYRATNAVAAAGLDAESAQELLDTLSSERVALQDSAALRRARRSEQSPTLSAEYAGALRRLRQNGQILEHRTARSPLAAPWARLSKLIDQELELTADETPAVEAARATQVARLEQRISAALWNMQGTQRAALNAIHGGMRARVEHIRRFVLGGTSLGSALLLYGLYELRRENERRTRSEQSARESEESLSTTLMSIGDAVIATDTQGRIARMNHVAETLTGWTDEAARGKPSSEVFRVVSEGTRAAVPSPIERTLRIGSASTLPERSLLLRADGRELPIEDTCSPVRDSAERLRGAVLVFRDVSAARESQALQEAARQQMIFSDRMVAIGTLAAGVAHEINNPLTYVITNLEMMREELKGRGVPNATGAELLEMTAEALQGALRVKRIVKGMKTFSRTDAPEHAVLDVHPILELALNMTSNEVRHRARLVRRYGSTPPIEGDEGRLAQVFVNLLVNAAQAIVEGSVEQNEIRVSTATDEQGRAVIEVHDSGAGIPPEVLPRIFEPFFTTKPVGVGTGLGLSICHNIVTGLGGELSVRSEPGLGSSFRVALPPATGVRVRAAHAPSEPAIGSADSASILIVDDEPRVGQVLARLLKEHRVTVVTSGAEALALIDEGRSFDAVLSDLMMPKMSGMDLYQALAERHPELTRRVVFLTGGAFTLAARAFLERVDRPLLEKPFTLDVVRRTLDGVLGAEREAARRLN